MTPLRFKAVQNHCVPWPPPASRCIAIASRLKANPHRAFAAQYRASPSRFDSSQYHCQTMLCCSVRRHCFSAHCFAIPWLYIALPYAALPPLRIASPYHSVAFPGTSRRLISMPSHRMALLLNTSPSLCETSPSRSISALRQSPLFLCVAEIRIAPQSLCCSSGSKTELSLSYAVLGRAALHLSVAEPCATSLFLCLAKRGRALPLPYFSTLCCSLALPSFALLINTLPCHCEAYRLAANRRHCPVRRAY